MTEVVYICTADRGPQVAYSLTTLLKSGSNFDRATIYVIGDKEPGWTTRDERVRVRSVPSFFGPYIPGNKVLLCDSEADTVIFLDADTFVLKPIDIVLSEVEDTFFGRVDPYYKGPLWNRTAWRETFDRFNVPELPMYNSGFLVFRNFEARKIKSIWSENINRFLNGNYTLPVAASDGGARLVDQFALSLSVAQADIRYGHMTAIHHWFGWRDGYNKDAVVFHVSNEQFQHYVDALNFREEELTLSISVK
jgi:hypothetical protein